MPISSAEKSPGMGLRVVARVVGRAVLTVALLGGVIVLGQIPWGNAGEEAALRVALRTVRGKIEICRELSEEEKRTLPIHMQGTRNCDTLPITYRLRITIGGREMADELVQPGGMRRDRPHNVDQEFSVSPGEQEVVVLFEPQPPPDPSPEAEAAMGDLPTYELRRALQLEADRVTLIYLNDTTGELDVLGG